MSADYAPIGGSLQPRSVDYVQLQRELVNMDPEELRALSRTMVHRNLNRTRPAKDDFGYHRLSSTSRLSPARAFSSSPRRHTASTGSSCNICGVAFCKSSIAVVSCSLRGHLFCQPCALQVSSGEPHVCAVCLGFAGAADTTVRDTSLVDPRQRNLTAEMLFVA